MRYLGWRFAMPVLNGVFVTNEQYYYYMAQSFGTHAGVNQGDNPRTAAGYALYPRPAPAPGAFGGSFYQQFQQPTPATIGRAAVGLSDAPQLHRASSADAAVQRFGAMGAGAIVLKGQFEEADRLAAEELFFALLPGKLSGPIRTYPGHREAFENERGGTFEIQGTPAEVRRQVTETLDRLRVGPGVHAWLGRELDLAESTARAKGAATIHFAVRPRCYRVQNVRWHLDGGGMIATMVHVPLGAPTKHASYDRGDARTYQLGADETILFTVTSQHDQRRDLYHGEPEFDGTPRVGVNVFFYP
jgi:hypothetical protein